MSSHLDYRKTFVTYHTAVPCTGIALSTYDDVGNDTTTTPADGASAVVLGTIKELHTDDDVGNDADDAGAVSVFECCDS